ncbi:MAG: transglycosylase domain-containing protein, partial [Gaiellales bacterium]
RSTESRKIVGSKEISQDMKNAVVAVEDRRFYDHRGVDLPGIARAVFNRLTAGTNEGASTITQQLVKNTYLTNEQTVERKVREASLAWQLEQRWSKDRILTAYLNTVYFGHNTYGVEEASKFYFNSTANALDPADSALLAAILKSPSTYDPLQNPEVALSRRNIVLDQMAEQGLLDPDAAEIEKSRRLLPLSREEVREPGTAFPYWVQFITEQLVNRYGTGQTFGGGLKVMTSLDAREQRIAETALARTLPRPGPQGAIVSIEPETGQVKAMAGGKPYSVKHQFNVPANAHRQPGSAFKPFVYLAALEEGIRPSTVFRSKKVLYDLGGEQFWYVRNSENDYGDDLTIPQAMAVSDNTVFAQLTWLVKPAPIADVARRLGITTPIDDGQPAIGLGGLFIGVTPLEMAQAYATLANEGRRTGGSILFHTPDAGIEDPSLDPISILSIEFPDGSKVVNAPRVVEVVSREDALTVIDSMRSVITDGTGQNARIGRPAAGKTGTTTDYKDAWFVGMTPQRAVSTWVGYENPALPMARGYNGTPVYGGTYPAIMWSTFLKAALRNQPAEDWAYPSGVQSVPISIDPATGLRVDPACEYAEVVVWALDRLPQEVLPCDADLVPVPDFTSSTKRRANSLSIGSGLLLRYEYRPAEPFERPGTVVAQSPAPLSAVVPGTVVTLAIARRVPNVLVPGVIASDDAPSTAETAIARLQAAGFRVVVQDQQDARGMPLGSVVSQDPAAGELAPRDAVVTIWASGDYTGTLVPQVVGRTFAEAEPLLDQAGLLPQGINADGALLPQDKVFRVEPSSGSKVPPGTAVTLFVSPF